MGAFVSTARYRHKLPFTLRKLRAALLKHGIVAVRQALYERIRAADFCRRANVVRRCVRMAVGYVVLYRLGEQRRILKHNAERAP